MRAYLLTTGIAFGLIVVAHVWRVVAESHALVRDPGFIVLTLIAASMSGWAFYLVRSSARAK
jgi:tetrahydromethanopterin S-methyltransferase subunit E